MKNKGEKIYMETNITFQIDNRDYVLKEINKEFRAQIKHLFDRCKDYFYLVESKQANEGSINEFLEDLPQGKTLKDKHTLGIFNNEKLIGVIDLVENYPNKNEWIIGLLLIDPGERGYGLGKKVHKILEDISNKGQGEKLRIGVVEQNKSAVEFWKKIGYTEIKRTQPIKYSNRENIVIIMNYLL